jgi:hypothetical protein
LEAVELDDLISVVDQTEELARTTRDLGQLLALPLTLIHRATEVVRVLTYSLRCGCGPLSCKDVGAGVPR